MMSDDLTGNLLKTISGQLGARWDALSVADRQLVAEVAADATGLHLQALATDPNDPAAAQSLAAEMRQVDAQLASLQSVGVAQVRGAFWQGFASVAQVALKIGLAAVGVSPALVDVVSGVVGGVAAPGSMPPGQTADPLASDSGRVAVLMAEVSRLTQDNQRLAGLLAAEQAATPGVIAEGEDLANGGPDPQDVPPPPVEA